MPTLSLQSLHHAYGADPVLQDVTWRLENAERLCLVGRNGEGKSTLMRLLAGVETPDSGELYWSSDTVIGYVDQPLPKKVDTPIREFILGGAGDAGDAVIRYERGLADDPQSPEVVRWQQWIDDHHAWDLISRADAFLSSAGMEGGMALGELSGGWRRKALILRALIRQPTVLLLDEPTNHLDIDSIEWLEGLLKDFRGLLIFISHDRRFIDDVAEVIVELDRSRLYRHPVPYERFLESREERLRVEAEQNAEFDRRLAQEEAWIRQGVKARRTRNEGRVRRLEALRAERAKRRNLSGTVDMDIQTAARSGQRVLDLKALTFRFGDQPIVEGLTTQVSRGDRVALVGNNGVGKSTLIRLLLHELQPDSGSVVQGTNLAVAYFDQGRHQLNGERTLMDTVSEGREFIEMNGRQIHVVSWLERFLFSPRQARSPVRTLSGGEANRLLLARLFSQPANLLVLDEPTNDLDIDTLELLEELIVDFDGTVIMTSHDRYFIDNVATQVWGMPGAGRVIPVVGGYREWLQYRQRHAAAFGPSAGTPGPSREGKGQKTGKAPGRRPKLSYRDQREYEGLPERIESLETSIQALQERTSDPDFYQQDPETVESTLEELARQQAALDAAMERWVELEEQVGG